MKEARLSVSGKEKRLRELTTDIEHIVDLMIKGTAPAAMEARVHSMEAEQQALISELNTLKQEDKSVNLHPGTAEKYKRVVEELQSHLDNIDALDGLDAIFSQIRGLIKK